MFRSILKYWVPLFFMMAVVFSPLVSEGAPGFYMGLGFGMADSAESGDLISKLDPDNGVNFEILHAGYNFNDNWGICLQWGTAFGSADSIKSGDTTGSLADLYRLVILGSTHDWSQWSQEYITLSGRYFFDTGNAFVPYVDAGLGVYELGVEEMTNLFFFLPVTKGDRFEFDPTLGYRLGVGAHYYIKNWYIAPELSYHFVNYSEVEFTTDDDLDVTADVDTTADMLLLQLKFGWHWKK